MKSELDTFDGLDNRREIMILLDRLGSDQRRARFIEGLIPSSLKGFAGCPMKVTGNCDPVSAYFMLVSTCNELGVSINTAARKLEAEVNRRPAASKLILSLLAFAASYLPVQAQDLTLTAVKKVVIEKVMPVEKGQVITASDFPLTATSPEGGFGYSWDVPAGFVAKRKANKLEISSAPKGSYEIGVEYSIVDFDAKKVDTKYLSLALIIGDGPAPPVPPGPNPPEPPGPTPAPIGINGLAVLMVYESSEILPIGKQNVIAGKVVRDYLDSKCVTDPSWPNGKAYWITDKDVNAASVNKIWQDALKRPRQAVPWIVISNPSKGGYEGPLPNTPEEAITLLKKYES